MKKNHLFNLLIITSIPLFIGCAKENTEPQIKLKPEPKLFIRGIFEKDTLEFLNYTEALNNYYEYASNPFSNAFVLMMHEKTTYSNTRFVQILITRIGIDTLKTPWESSLIPYYPTPYVQLSLNDNSETIDPENSNNNINYSGATLNGDQVYVSIKAIIGDTIEGSFHGDIKTKTGLIKHVTNGEYKVKFHRTQL